MQLIQLNQPPEESRIKLYSCPVDLYLQGSISTLKALSVEGRVGWYTRHKVLYQAPGFSGSSGGLVALSDGSALGMHLVGINSAKLAENFRLERATASAAGDDFDPRDDVTLASDSNAQALGVLSEAVLLYRMRRLIRSI
jgi:hypothetical protein